MNFIASKLKALARHVSVVVDKLCNTFRWLLFRRNVVVANVFLRHRLSKIRPRNLGDDLNLVIIENLSSKKIVSYLYSYVSLFSPLNYVCIGSIVESKTNRKSIIWGSGAMYGLESLKERPLKVHAVRGPLTRSYLLSQGIECPEIYGDPVILLPLIYPVKKEKKYKMGLIPHYVDLEVDSINRIKNEYGEQIVIINLRNYKKWSDVVDLINECEFIASSSLHGIIISDAYNVPNVWIRLSDNVKGENFKFLDYFKGCNRPVVKPIDFREEDIDFFLLQELAKEYVMPKYDLNAFLGSCPFVSKSFLKRCKL